MSDFPHADPLTVKGVTYYPVEEPTSVKWTICHKCAAVEGRKLNFPRAETAPLCAAIQEARGDVCNSSGPMPCYSGTYNMRVYWTTGDEAAASWTAQRLTR